MPYVSWGQAALITHAKVSSVVNNCTELCISINGVSSHQLKVHSSFHLIFNSCSSFLEVTACITISARTELTAVFIEMRHYPTTALQCFVLQCICSNEWTPCGLHCQVFIGPRAWFGPRTLRLRFLEAVLRIGLILKRR